MRDQVGDWLPPTEDHFGLQDFMIQQIDLCTVDETRAEQRLQEALDEDVTVYHTVAIEATEHGIEYHRKNIEDRKDPKFDAQQWLDQLRDSLKPKTANV